MTKLIADEKLSKVFSSLDAVKFVCFVFFLFLLFASYTFAQLVVIWTGEMWMSFLAVALFFYYWDYCMVYQGEIRQGSNYECDPSSVI